MTPQDKGSYSIRSAGFASLAITAMILGFMLLLIQFTPVNPTLVNKKFLDLYVQAFGIYDSTGQRLAHQAALAGACLVLIIGFFRKANWLVKHANGIALLAILILTAAYFEGSDATIFSGEIGIVIFLLILSCIPRKPLQKLAPLCWGFLLLILALFLLPGLSRPFDLSSLDAGNWEWISLHYSFIVGQADRLAQGLYAGTNIQANYGLLMPVLLGGWQRHFGMLNIGEHIAIIEAMQALFCLLIGYGLYLWKRAPLKVLLGLAIVLPWFYPSNLLVEVPNLTAWRVFGLSITPLAIYWACASLAPRRMLSLGALAGILLFFNPETGVVSLSAVLLSVFLGVAAREKPRSAPYVKPCLALLAGMIASAACFLILHRVCLGHWPGLSWIKSSLDTIRTFAGGYCGLQLHFDLVAAVIFFHSFYVFIRTMLLRKAWKHAVTRARAAIAFAILVWFAYYANRPAELNLIVFYPLYAFLAVDLVRFRLKGLSGRSAAWAARNALTCVILAALVPMALKSNAAALARLQQVRQNLPAEGAVLVSGVYMRKDIADMLGQKADFIRQSAVSARHPLIYISPYSYMLPLLSGIYPDLPVADVMDGARTEKDYARIAAWIRDSPNGDTVYFDQTPVRPYYRDIQDRLKKDIGLIARGTASGWDIYTRR